MCTSNVSHHVLLHACLLQTGNTVETLYAKLEISGCQESLSASYAAAVDSKVPLLHCTDSSAYASKAHTKAGRRGLHLRAVGTCHISPEALARQIPVITAQSSSLGNVVGKLLAGSAGWSCQDRLAGGGDQASHLSPSSQVVKDLQQYIIYPPQYGPHCIAWLVHDPDLSAQHLLSWTTLEDKQF